MEQSEAPQVAGFVVRDAIAEPSSAHAESSLGDYFRRTNVTAIAGIDTRALTRRIRNEGAMRGMITTNMDRPVGDVVAELKNSPSMSGLDLVQRVTALRPYSFEEIAEPKMRVALYDFGVKKDILRQLVKQGCDVTIYPGSILQVGRCT